MVCGVTQLLWGRWAFSGGQLNRDGAMGSYRTHQRRTNTGKKLTNKNKMYYVVELCYIFPLRFFNAL